MLDSHDIAVAHDAWEERGDLIYPELEFKRGFQNPFPLRDFKELPPWNILKVYFHGALLESIDRIFSDLPEAHTEFLKSVPMIIASAFDGGAMAYTIRVWDGEDYDQYTLALPVISDFYDHMLLETQDWA